MSLQMHCRFRNRAQNKMHQSSMSALQYECVHTAPSMIQSRLCQPDTDQTAVSTIRRTQIAWQTNKQTKKQIFNCSVRQKETKQKMQMISWLFHANSRQRRRRHDIPCMMKRRVNFELLHSFIQMKPIHCGLWHVQCASAFGCRRVVLAVCMVSVCSCVVV